GGGPAVMSPKHGGSSSRSVCCLGLDGICGEMPAMSSAEETFKRLRDESWTDDAKTASMNDASCKFQKLADGSGTYVYDDYSVVITTMPKTLTADAYLLEFAKSPNDATNNGLFNPINRFTKRPSTAPKTGDW